jgi:hypothetical protein
MKQLIACVVDTDDKHSLGISPRNFEKFRNGLHGILRDPGETGKLIHEKNLKLKISSDSL